ncbi:MAG: hypothetical protein J0H74_23590 [Chitinophagaceae bacterium]|nr:hypothetical protein [Chitinophagaceae bacterium]
MTSSDPRPSPRVLYGILLAMLSLPLIFSSCRKVDAHDDMIQNYPFLATTGGLSGLYNIHEYAYPQILLVGDTCTLIGKMFLDRPGTSIQVGQANAVIIAKAKVWAAFTNSRTGLPDSFDVARFIITRDMGVGPRISVTLNANGYSIQGEPIAIRLLPAGNHQTDTSLVVDKLASWLPANAATFPGAFVNNSSVSGDGVIYFDNPTGIYQVKNSSVSPIISAGDNIKDQNNSNFAIDVIISSVISPDGNTLTFSATVKENIPRTDTLFITRLCQMNMITRSVTTLNRSSFLNSPNSPAYNEDPSPYNGKVGQIKLTASRLQTDVNGNIWFINIYFPANTGASDFNGPYIASQYFYPFIAQGQQPFSGCLFNLCQLTADGKVQSIGRYVQAYDPTSSPYATPGILYDDDLNPPVFLVSKDASMLLGFKYNVNFFPAGIYQMDVAGEEIANTILPPSTPWKPTAFSFKSYDTSALTRKPNTNSFSIRSSANSVFNRFLILPDNELLFCDINSIFSYDLQHLSAYCYAGTENQNTSLQNQETGKAKWVNFGDIGPLKNNALIFCGVDRQGAIYYCKGGSTEPFLYTTVVNDITNGVRFYKLHH